MDYNNIRATSIPLTFSSTDFTTDCIDLSNAIQYHNNCINATITPERFIIKCNLPY